MTYAENLEREEAHGSDEDDRVPMVVKDLAVHLSKMKQTDS